MLPGVLVSVVLAFVYALGIDGPWLWDDHMLIESSPVVTEGASLLRYFGEALWTVDTSVDDVRAFYRPLVVLSYRADWLLHHGGSAGFHLTNVLAFGLCALLAHAWLLRLKLPPTAAALAVAAWGASPHLVESVGWISGRTDLFAALFALAGLVAWPSVPSAGARRALRLAASLVALLAALLSKEVAMAAMLVLILHALRGADRRRRVLEGVALAGTTAVYLALRINALGRAPSTASKIHFSVARSFAALGTYTEMLVDPRAASLHGSPGVTPAWIVALGSLAFVAGVAALVILRRHRQAFALLVLLGASLGPVLHVIPLPLDVLVADRYLFIPLFAAYALVALGASRLPSGAAMRSSAALALLFLIAEIGPLLRRIDDHRDELRFWLEAERTRTTPSARPLVEVGRILFEARRFNDVLQILAFAIRQHAFGSSELPVARHNFALAAFALGDVKTAQRELEVLTSEHAPTVAARLFAVDLALASGRFADAETLLAAIPEEARGSSVVIASHARVEEARRYESELREDHGRSEVDTLWLRARFASSFLGARRAERAWAALSAHPEATKEARMAAVAALGEVARPEVMRAALAELIARDGESAMTHAAALVLEDLERKWSRGAEVMRTLRFDR